MATDKYLSDVMDPPTNTLRRTRPPIWEGKREKSHMRYSLCKRIDAAQCNVTKATNDGSVFVCSIHSMIIAYCNGTGWIVADRFYALWRKTEKNETLIALVATSRRRRVINAGLQYATVDRHVCCRNVLHAQVINEIQG